MIRRARNPHDFTVMLANFTPVPRPGYRIGVPEGGWYRETYRSSLQLVSRITRRKTWEAACLRAKANPESVLPPPVGTVRENKPGD